MNRYMRIRHYNPLSNSERFDTLFPQTITGNILRQENGGVLENDLLSYDRHLDNNVSHMNRALSTGTSRALFVSIKDKVLVDNFPLLLTLHINLEAEPTLVFNDGPAYEIISADGTRIPGGQIEGSVIFLIWKKSIMKWVLMSSNNFSDVTKVVLPVLSEYVYEALGENESVVTLPGFNKKSDKVMVNYNQTVLRQGIDYEFDRTRDDTFVLTFELDKGDLLYCTITSFITTAKHGHYKYELRDHTVNYTVEEDDTTELPIPPEADGAHSILVNYGQTILRNGLDFTYNKLGDHIVLKNISLNKGENITYTITNFMEVPGDLLPNNWGSSGNYRYSFNVVHTSYTATEDHVAVISVPGFNFKRDDITVIRFNKVYIYDVDYTIDEIGNIVLLKDILNTGDEIFFTILQGAMMDVPNFNVAQCHAVDGQHLLVDFSHSVLCDFYTLLLRLNKDLKTAPTLKCIDGPALPIYDCFNNPIIGGYKKESFLWLVFSERNHCWYSMSHSQVDISQFIPTYNTNSGYGNFIGIDPDTGDFREVIIPHGLGVVPAKIDIVPCEPPSVVEGEVTTIGDIWNYADETNIYIGNSGTSTSKFKWTASTQDTSNDIKGYVDKEIEILSKKPGNYITHASVYKAEADDIVTIKDIEEFNGNYDRIEVNFNQTVLREGLDFIVEDNGIKLLNISLKTGDTLQFIVIKQTPTFIE